jgi:hypothetical protein
MNDRDFNFPLLLPNLAVLLFVAVGLLSNTAPLVSHRPEGSASVALDVNEAPARLWEDPFGVKAPPPPASGQSALRDSLSRARYEKSAALNYDPTKGRNIRPEFHLLILPVLLSSEKYPETIEQRLRTRYAVVSALGRAQYVSTKPNRLQFAFLPDSDQAIPFEQFEVRRLVADDVEMLRNENFWPPGKGKMLDAFKARSLTIDFPYDHVIVLWLNEEKILHAEPPNFSARTADAQVQRIIEPLLAAARTPTTPISPSSRGLRLVEFSDDVVVSVKIIGPTSSDKLVSLLERQRPPLDLRDENVPPLTTPEPSRTGTPFQLLSPRATAPNAALQISVTHNSNFEGFGLNSLSETNPPWSIRRTIAKDDQLVDTVLGELKRRRAEPGPGSHLVLVGEWDTLYSRALARTFAAKLNVRQPGEFSGGLSNPSTWAINPAYLHEFSYLRGLDGRLAGADPSLAESDQDNASDDDAPTESEGKDRPDTTRESPVGRSQLDYLRRLEGSVRNLQTRLDKSGGKIGAIGVIGSDTYDKLLVLRALRASFPHAVFFTTDFDASYLERGEDKWTTNLVVVSPYGLTTSPALQGRIPPFRDSYQTALFLTVLDAVGVTEVGGEKLMIDSASITPRIFELGRGGQYVDLSPAETNPQAAVLHPSASIPHLELWWLALTLAGLGFAWLCLKTTPREFFDCTLALLWLVALVGWFAVVVRLFPDVSRVLGILAPLALGGVLLAPFYMLRQRYRTFGELVAGPHGGRSNHALLLLCGCLVIGATLILVFSFSKASGWSEEPFAWFKGLSIWPSVIVRLAAAVFAILAIVVAQDRLDRLKNELTQRFFAKCSSGTVLVSNQSAQADVTIKTSGNGQKTGRLVRDLKGFWLANESEQSASATTSISEGKGKHEYPLWLQYLELTGPRQRFMRVVGCVAVYIFVFRLLTEVGVFTAASVPVRGEWSHVLDRAISHSEVAVYCMLLFFVVDATILTANLIEKLTPYIPNPKDLNEADAIHHINELTKAVSGLVYLPFSVLFMMIVARNPLFDAYAWPPLTIAHFGSGLLLIVVAAVTLQGRARAAKQTALDSIDRQIITQLETEATVPRVPVQVKTPAPVGPDRGAMERDPYGFGAPQGLQRVSGVTEPDPEISEKLLREKRNQITAFTSVAFREWHHNPIFRAILIPLGGVGSLQLLEKFSGVF